MNIPTILEVVLAPSGRGKATLCTLLFACLFVSPSSAQQPKASREFVVPDNLAPHHGARAATAIQSQGAHGGRARMPDVPYQSGTRIPDDLSGDRDLHDLPRGHCNRQTSLHFESLHDLREVGACTIPGCEFMLSRPASPGPTERTRRCGRAVRDLPRRYQPGRSRIRNQSHSGDGHLHKLP